MCYNISYIEQKQKKLQERYKHLTPINWSGRQLDLQLHYFVSGFDHPHLPVITSEGLDLFEWGLIPSWVKNVTAAKEFQPKTLNAVGETVFEKPAFKDSIIRQRCLVPVNGFFEWRDFKKVKYPHFIRTKSNDIFSIGGIFNKWIDKSSGEIHTTFSILTTPANPMMEKIHNMKKRMPLIIAPEDEALWINPEIEKDVIQFLIKPYDENDMTSYTVTRDINNARNDRNKPEMLKEVVYPELNELTLFEE